MSIHQSLVSKSRLTRRRNVLTRTERIEKLQTTGRWDAESDSVFGLPSVRPAAARKAGKKKKKKKEADE